MSTSLTLLPKSTFGVPDMMVSLYFTFQPAVEALSEREAQLALRNEIDDFVDTEDFDLNNGE